MIQLLNSTRDHTFSLLLKCIVDILDRSFSASFIAINQTDPGDQITRKISVAVVPEPENSFDLRFLRSTNRVKKEKVDLFNN